MTNVRNIAVRCISALHTRLIITDTYADWFQTKRLGEGLYVARVTHGNNNMAVRLRHKIKALRAGVVTHVNEYLVMKIFMMTVGLHVTEATASRGDDDEQ